MASPLGTTFATSAMVAWQMGLSGQWVLALLSGGAFVLRFLARGRESNTVSHSPGSCHTLDNIANISLSEEFNWSPVMFVGILSITAIYYFVKGRHEYEGPVVLVKRHLQ